MTIGQVLAFAGIIVLGAVSPGPDFAVVARRAAVSGRRAGMAAAAGVAAGVFVWAVAAAAGLTAAMTALPALLTLIRYAGAAYLAYLGVRALYAAIRRPAPAEVADGAVTGRTRHAFRDGLLCNVLNPKAAVFFVALLPQFLPQHPHPADTLVLALIAVAITLAWFIAVANLIAALRRVLARPAARRALDAVTGSALLGMGARLALTGAR
jgi:threonine/homoserine/homoserine lactone efflux protein